MQTSPGSANDSPTRRSRRFDPARRERIIEAGLRVVEQHGSASLTFRAVADEADVPLGSTTYHFTGKDELLEAVAELSRRRNREYTVDVLADAVDRFGLAGGIAVLIEKLTAAEHDRLVVEHDLFLSALRIPRLRDQSRRWSLDFVEIISPHCDRLTAETLGFLVDGICLQSAILGRKFTAAEVEPNIRLVAPPHG